ncbi:tRNA (uracil(54)-C(5))-methyltransferase homolog-B isoform X2 [Ixodes scapularis]|uniref:tRNA (uracil(54)-C(5))-methyltransferase homolog-B isoform X2 n=1 Tax=Ixodes scapularis TaxID=6945 RepID=UPI001A9E7339|nr:tRNA (uracil(54)-C(5))-methyltransferase homolog-B isoform X2 [Ixodes scapularis]
MPKIKVWCDVASWIFTLPWKTWRRSKHLAEDDRVVPLGALAQEHVTPEEPHGAKPQEQERAVVAPRQQKRVYKVDQENKYDRLAYSVTPLWKHPYRKQLMFKYQDLTVVLQKLGRKLSAAGVDFPADPKGLPCPLRPVVPSPVLEGYRNKDEFSIREGPSGEPKVVGFLVGSPTGEGKAVCVSPDHVIICKESHKRVARAFQRYIQRSPLAGCYETNFQGHWKNVVVRSNSRDDVMAIVVMHPQQLTQEQLIAEKQGLVDYFVHGEGKDCNLASLYFQACPHTRCSHEQAPFELLHGPPHLQEEMGDLRFRLSPESFFQVNSAVAGFMYDAVRQMLDCNQHSTLLDICCGTGTIGLTMARGIHSVFGMDASSQAVEDASHNAQLNGITNARFVAGRAEHLVPNMRNEFFAEELCAVVNPGRGGLSSKAIRAMRDYKQIKRLVYISCKPEGVAQDNFVQLCRSTGRSRLLGPPFRPLLACPVDMFPQTRHCELIMLFGRS